MTTKEYVMILKFVIETQINYVKEDPYCDSEEESTFYEGMVRGLEIALEKIDASKFLYEGK